ncbi:MAG: hypothetical protein Q9165_007797 [Trypethelium subeluteriae]
MAPAYNIAELRQLRTSASESTIALEKAVKEDVVKEHVLRNSSSFTSRNSLRQENNRTELPQFVRPQNGRFGNAKYSPTPSIKRGKAERLLKEHGSPPGLRVTAGGKIVPSDMTPLCSPRFGFGQPNKQGFINISPFEGHQVIPAPMMPGRPMPAGGVLPFSPFFGFTPDGQCVPLMPIPCGGIPPYMNNDQFAHMPPPWSSVSGPPVTPVPQAPMGPPVQGFAGSVTSLTLGQQAQALEREQAKLNDEFRTVDQAGVIHQGVLNASQRAALVARKVSLTNRLDEIRVSLKKLKTSEESKPGTTPPERTQPAFGQPLPKPTRPGFSASQMTSHHQPSTSAGPFGNFPYFQVQNQYPGPPIPVETQPQMVDPSAAPFLIPNGLQCSSRSLSAPTSTSANEPATAPSVSLDRPGSIETSTAKSPASTHISHEPRRSHAIAIKNPQDGVQQGMGHSQKSPLDPTRPMSQTQDGTRRSSPVCQESEPSPYVREALGKDYNWPNDAQDGIDAATSPFPRDCKIQHKPSLSSVSTADFFPNNPLEHSAKNVRPQQTSDSGLLAPPVTPNRSSPGPLTRHVDCQDSEAPASPAPNSFRVSSWNAACDPIPDRMENNMSPKARFSGPVGDRNGPSEAIPPRKISKGTPAASAVSSGASEESKSRGFSQRYCEGYYSGLHRLALSKDEDGEVLEGYIAGLQHFAELQAALRKNRLRATDNGVEDVSSDAAQEGSRHDTTVELKENSTSPPATRTTTEVEKSDMRSPSAQYGAPLTQQFSGNQIQSFERSDRADKPQPVMDAIPTRVTSVGQGIKSPGGSLGENRSRNISLPMNRTYQPASFNWTQTLPQHDGATDKAINTAAGESNQTEALTELPNEPVSDGAEKALSPPAKSTDSPTKSSPWQAKSPKSPPSKPSRSPTKSRLDRLASHLGVRKPESAHDNDDISPGSHEMGASMSPSRKKRREEFKHFLSRPKGEQPHELKPVEKEKKLQS